MTTLDLCEKFFKTRDIYQLLEVAKDASPSDIKKAYYKLSLQVHPDRVKDGDKKMATEKFKVLSKLYQVLSDKDSRTLYDEQGIINIEGDDMECNKLSSWLVLWKQLFKPLTTEDIITYEKSYVNSDHERADIRKAYLSGKGCINHMMNEVPFLKVQDEPRIQQIVREMIDANEVPEYSIFTKEPAQKRNRRHKKHARESKEADEIKEKLYGSKNALEQQIMERRNARQSSYESFMDSLLAKYGDEDDDDVIDFSAIDKKAKKKKTAAASRSKKEKETTSKVNIRRVQNGKVKKRKN